MRAFWLFLLILPIASAATAPYNITSDGITCIFTAEGISQNWQCNQSISQSGNISIDLTICDQRVKDETSRLAEAQNNCITELAKSQNYTQPDIQAAIKQFQSSNALLQSQLQKANSDLSIEKANDSGHVSFLWIPFTALVVTFINRNRYAKKPFEKSIDRTKL